MYRQLRQGGRRIWRVAASLGMRHLRAARHRKRRQEGVHEQAVKRSRREQITGIKGKRAKCTAQHALGQCRVACEAYACMHATRMPGTTALQPA